MDGELFVSPLGHSQQGADADARRGQSVSFIHFDQGVQLTAFLQLLAHLV